MELVKELDICSYQPFQHQLLNNLLQADRLESILCVSEKRYIL